MTEFRLIDYNEGYADGYQDGVADGSAYVYEQGYDDGRLDERAAREIVEPIPCPPTNLQSGG